MAKLSTKILTVILTVTFTCFLAFPEGTNNTTSSGLNKGPIFTPKINPKGNRPKAPSMQEIECSYSDGWLNISFRLNEGMATLYIYDSDQTTLRTQQVFYTDSEASLYVGDLNDAYLLIDTSYGHQYEGWI